MKCDKIGNSHASILIAYKCCNEIYFLLSMYIKKIYSNHAK